MERFDTIEGIRGHIAGSSAQGKSVSLVPTMGALHEGHRSCIEIARTLGDVTAVSIFVNPTQFGPKEDCGKYPRPIENDLELCREWGVDVVFSPGTSEMYPEEQDVWVDVGRVSKPLCGMARVGHFRGVATVVLKLFNIVRPDWAVFGQKDAQQVIVIRRMVRQFGVPVEIVLAPTLRERDGLARSSRNDYLSTNERDRAAGIYRSLLSGKDALAQGESDPARVAEEVRRCLKEQGIENVEYVELLSAEDLSTLALARGKVILAVAARVGSARLIDNVVLDVGDEGDVREVMLF